MINVSNPRTGEVDYKIEAMGKDDVSALAKRLRAAQPDWLALGPDGRAAVLLRWADALHANMAAVVERLSVDTGRVAIGGMDRSRTRWTTV